jgi:hypothetical protein
MVDSAGITTGIIFSAVTVFIIGLLTLLFGALTMSAAIASTTGTDFAPRYLGPFTIPEIPAAIALIAVGGWGIACGLAIVKRREWARKSMLAFGAIVFVVAIFGALGLILDPGAGVMSLEGIYMGGIRPELMALFVWLAGLGAFWLYFFVSKSVKERFAAIPDSRSQRRGSFWD